jgi:prepilin-type N-terminal cleavage/methylation domain-containing protein
LTRVRSSQYRSRPGLTRRRGLSLVEVLITVAICGALMTAVAAAYQATANAMQSGERFFRAQQTARVALTQMLAETRRCRSGSVDATTFEMVTHSGETRVYAYDAASRQITLTPHVGVAPYPTHVLARNVASANFDTAGDTISITIEVAVDNHRVALTGSAVPRKFIEYR